MADFTSRLDDAGRSTTEPTLRIGRLPSPARTSAFKNFFSNVKDFLSERPANIKGAKSDVFQNPEFGEGLGDNFKEFFRSAPRGRGNSDLLVNWNAGFGGFWQNVRDVISPRKMAPLKTTSAPVAVPEIWSKNTQFTRVQALSLAFHVVVIVLIIIPFWSELMSPGTTQAKTMVVTPLDITSPYLPKLPPGAKKAGGGGGGGSHELLPASRGKAPKFSLTQIVPPKVKPPDNPKFAAVPTVIGMPDTKLASPNMSNWGDPMSKVTNDSSGPGSGNGIGSGNGTGIGSGSGGGVGPGEGGGTGGGYFSAGTGGYGVPVCVYCPNAQFSDEAVKAKYQGTVTLAIVIMPDGHTEDIHVVKGLGLGLDENAVKAIRTWRFKPALGPNGKPAPVRMNVEMQFRLY